MPKISKILSAIILVLYLFTLSPINTPLAIAAEDESQPKPEITLIDPKVGSVNGGDRVRIYGHNLNLVSNVFFGAIQPETKAEILVKTPEQIVIKTPKREDGSPGVVDLILEYGSGIHEVYPNGFDYKTDVGIIAVTPNRGSVEGGVRVTINGYNFPIDEEGNLKAGYGIKIFFGSKEVEEDKMEFINSRTILVLTPQNFVATVDVSVEIEKDGLIEKAVLNNGYQYVEPESNPRIIKIFNEAVNKPIAPISGNVNIKAYVYDFQTGDTEPDSFNNGIFFGPPLLGLKLRVDANHGVRELTNGEKDEIENEFDLEEIFKDLEEKEGIKVTIDDIKAVTGELNITEFIDPGFYDVTLINPDGAIHQLPYYFQFKNTQMIIEGANPLVIQKEGTEIRFTVSNLTQDEFDNEILAFFINEKGEIEGIAIVNKEKSKLREDGLHDIYVETPKLSSGIKYVYLRSVFGDSNQFAIRVVEPDNKPIIHKIYGEEDSVSIKEPLTLDKPARGPITGGTDLVILGENFSDSLENPLRVFIDNVEATVIIVDTTVEEVQNPDNPEETIEVPYDRIIAKTGSLVGELPGLKDVTVINPGGGESRTGVFPKSFYYYSSPQITSVIPNKGHINGGNIITIEGEQFYPGLQIYFERDGIEIENPPSTTEYKLVDNNKLIVRIPNLNEIFPDGADLNEPVTIRIENIDGGTATWDKFRVHAPDGEVRIDKLIPDKGPYYGGTRVIIEGSGFTYPKGTVYFGLEEAQIEKWSENEIIVITPAQPEAGEFDVDVTVINEDTSLAILKNGFHYNHPKTEPKITKVFPTVGPKTGGTKIKITGSDFWTGAKVYIGPYEAINVEVVDSETITAYTGEADQAGTYEVIVVNPDSSISTGNVYFTYEHSDSNPQIIDVKPLAGPTTGGAIIHIQGTDFRKGIKVYFDDLQAQIVRFEEAENTEEESHIWVQLPAWPANRTERVVDVAVINTDGGVDHYEGFTYVDITPGSTPEIEEIIPNQGSLAGGTKVVITGDKFRTGAEVYFGHIKVDEEDVEVVRYDRIEVTTPPWTGELDKNGRAVVDVTVVNTGDSPGSATLKNGFTYLATRPEIYAIAPNIGSYKGGDIAIITGKDFTEEVQVFIGEMEVVNPEVDVQNGKITILTPSLEEAYLENYSEYLFKPLDVKVVNKDGETAVLPQAFTYKYPASKPKIIDVRPASGSTAGGQPIEIIGEDFREVFDDKGNQLLWPKVIIGGKEATDVVFENSGKLTCRIPPNNAGPARVIVINEDGGNGVWEHYFIYEEPKSEPKITSVVPNQGPDIGGTPVTIFGSDFRQGPNGEAPQVWFDNNLATDITWEAHNRITAVTPQGEGTADIIVVNPDKGQAILERGFTYKKIPVPLIYSVNPNSGPDTGGTAIEIKGEDFAKGAKVFIGENIALEIEVVDKNTIQAVTPPGEPGWQEVRVVNPDTGWAKLDEGFLYRGKPDEPGWLYASAQDYETIELVWSKVNFANYYEIYISNKPNGTYRFLAQTQENYYYATNLEPDTRYYFKVRAVNEVGVSTMTGYDYATTDDDAPRRKKSDAENIITAASGNQAEILIPSLKALKNEGYVLDLTQQKLQKPVQKITFKGEVLNDFSWVFTVKTSDFTLSVNPLSILGPQYWNASSSKLEGVYSSLVITDLGQREAERALKQLPKGAKILSKVYSVGWELAEGKKVTPQHLFFRDFYLTMDYKSADVPGGKNVDIFVYNDSLGKWEAAKAFKDSYYTRLNLSLIKPEKFVVVAY